MRSARTKASAIIEFDASTLRRAIVLVVAAKAAGIILLFDPTGVDAFHLIKSIYSYATAALLLALLLLALYRFGRSVVPRTHLHLLVLAFAMTNVVSALLAENAYLAVFGEHERYLGLLFLADMLLLYAAVAVGFRSAKDWAALAAAVAVAGGISVAYAALQSARLDPISWESAERPFGTFGNPDMLGHFLSLAFGAAVGVAAFASGRHAFARPVALAGGFVAVIAAMTIATRGSLLGFAAVLAVAMALAVRIRGLTRANVASLAVRGLLALAVITGLLAVSPLAERARTTMEGLNVDERLLIYGAAIAAVGDRPLFGYGPDNFGVAYPRYRQDNSTMRIGIGPATSAHSWPLQTAATTGLIGLATLLVLVYASLRSLWRYGRARTPNVAIPILLASSGYWANGLVAIDAITVDWWAWVAFGSAAALAPAPRAAAHELRRLPRLVPASAVLVAVLIAVSGLSAIRANEHALVAKFAAQEGRGEPALEAGMASVRMDPGRADYWNWLGLALEQTGRWPAAAGAYAEAAERAPHQAVYWSNLSRSRARQALAGDASAGGPEAALHAAQRAVELDPNAPEPNAVLSEIANLFGDYDLGLAAALRAIELYPREDEYENLAVLAAYSLSDPGRARPALETLLPIRDTAPLRVALAQLSLELGDREVARVHVLRALQLDPRHPGARAILSRTGG